VSLLSFIWQFSCNVLRNLCNVSKSVTPSDILNSAQGFTCLQIATTLLICCHFVLLEFEFRASCLLGRYSTTWATPSLPILFTVILVMVILTSVRWHLLVVLLISMSLMIHYVNPHHISVGHLYVFSEEMSTQVIWPFLNQVSYTFFAIELNDIQFVNSYTFSYII
jgi:hypothetical protein